MQHTPFDGSSPPFTIALKPVAPSAWLAGQPPLAPVLRQKARLMQTSWHDVFKARPGSLGAQGEALSLIVDHLHQDHPLALRVAGPASVRVLTLIETGERFLEAEWAGAPLALAARLVADDLVLMVREGGAWAFDAGCVCFPSSWRLEDKFAQPLEAIHAPVPGVNTSLGARINRIFDHLAPDRPLMRQNWSLATDPALRLSRQGNMFDWPPAQKARAQLPPIVIRVEHQTVRKLARSGAILFTIRIDVTPLWTLRERDDGAVLAGGLARELEALTPEQARYKGLGTGREAILALLRDWARDERR
ncbi:MAG: DUF3445 domain-containing protein [Alphaproteobacteria bacterium]